MKRPGVLFALIAGVGAALDLLTKTLVTQKILERDEVPIIPRWLSFGHAYNPGIVWSLGPGAKTLWLVVSIVAIPIVVAIFLRSRKTAFTTISLGMILAGTLGNCYDRIFFRGVRDFIMAYFVRSDGRRAVWPLFNLADSFIVIGVIVLSIEMLFLEPKPRPSEAAGGAPPAPSAPPPEPPP
jgi:signal peptidase II